MSCHRTLTDTKCIAFMANSYIIIFLIKWFTVFEIGNSIIIIVGVYTISQMIPISICESFVNRTVAIIIDTITNFYCTGMHGSVAIIAITVVGYIAILRPTQLQAVIGIAEAI